MGDYDKDRDGLVLDDGNLIRVQDKDKDGKVRISIYEGDERKKGEHKRTTITYDEKTGKGKIDSHNEDKTENDSKDISCYLTTACLRHFKNSFDDNCYELTVLRWFRDNYVLVEDINYYYEIAPLVVEGIDNEENSDIIYEYIYDNVVDACVTAIENGNYLFAYNRYKESMLSLENYYVLKNKKLVRK